MDACMQYCKEWWFSRSTRESRYCGEAGKQTDEIHATTYLLNFDHLMDAFWIDARVQQTECGIEPNHAAKIQRWIKNIALQVWAQTNMLMGSYAHHSDIIQLATTQNMLVCKYLIGEITSVPDRISKNNVRLGIRMRENIRQYFEHYSIISSCFWSYNLTRLHAEAVPSRENRTDSWIFFKIGFNLTNFAFAVSKRSFFTTSNRCNRQLFRIILAPKQPHRS